jgi:hypothetical protein
VRPGGGGPGRAGVRVPNRWGAAPVSVEQAVELALDGPVALAGRTAGR